MFFFYDASDALFAFMQRGGDTLYLIGLLAFVMWFLIFERIWYYFFTHGGHINDAVSQWEGRTDKLSWNSVAIRDMLLSENTNRIDQNLDLISSPRNTIPVPEVILYDDRFTPKEGDQCWAVSNCSPNKFEYQISQNGFFKIVELNY